MRFMLSDDDHKRYGLPAGWIFMDINRFTNQEADLVERPEPDGPGLDPEDWLECLRGEPAEDKGVPLIDEETGEAIRRPSRRTVSIMFWLGVRRAGVDVAWPDWTYDLLGYIARRDDQPDHITTLDEADELGKEPGGSPSQSDDAD
jgi:hypothetical protein